VSFSTTSTHAIRIRLTIAFAAVVFAVSLGFGARDAGAAVPLSSLQWTKLVSPSSPPPLYAASLAYEPGAKRMLLFGGQGSSGNSDQTWAWDGADWTHLAPAESPLGGYAAPLAYDPGSEEMLLFSEGTWTWDGTDWADAAPAQSPSARNGTQMAYDAANEQMLLFGGAIGLWDLVNDTWAWDGSNWAELSPAHKPSTRESAAMAYDAANEQLILFGGLTVKGLVPTDLNDTWAWDGTDWKELTPPHSPPARAYASMAYDAEAERLILFGGYRQDGTTLGDTWAWDGTDWEELTYPTSPPARSVASMAYDAADERMILFGGSGVDTFDDTWVFGPPIPPDKPSDPGVPSAGGGSTSLTRPPLPDPPPANCVVPKLGGKKLKAAKRTIRAANCKAGKVSKSKGTTAQTGRVKSQGPKPGKILAPGAKIDIRLAA
jgi:hypothetical protein